MEMNLFALDQKLETLQARRHSACAAAVAEFDERIDVSWIYHDNALEGVVISYYELKAAIDARIISDVTLIPMYEEIKNHKVAIGWVRELAAQSAKKKKISITVETLRAIHSMLCPEEAAKGAPYRKDNPLHRLYFHEISPPDKIPLRMKKLIEWLDEEETQPLHPIERAARAHCRFMAVFPWIKSSGKVARLLMNYLLMRDGYPPVIIHSIDRQRYYESMRGENAGMVPLVYESMENGIETAVRFFDEFKQARRSVRKAS